MKTKAKPRHSPVRRVKRAEKRSGYQTPAQWLIDALVGEASTSGAVVNEATALTYSVVFACVRNISEDIAKLPLILYKRLKPQGKERADTLDLYRLLKDAPNEEMSSMDFRQAVMVDVLLGGNGYAEVIRNGASVVVALQKICRSRVTPKRNDAGRIVYMVKQSGGEDATIAAENMLHIRGMGDGLVGYSVIKLAKECIGLAMAAENSASSFLGNNSLPSGVLELVGKMKPEAIANLRTSWEAMHSGPKNKHKIAILEEGMKFNPLSVTPGDAQFLESRQFQVEDVARWFRMPPNKIGDRTRAQGWSTVEATNVDYVTDTLMPWAERWEQEIQRKLIPTTARDLFAEHLFDALLRGDTAARAAFYTAQFNVGAMSSNDIRESENRNPVEGGSTYFISSQLTPLEIAIKGPQVPPAALPAPAPPSDPAKASANRQKRLELIANAHSGALSEAFSRVLRVEMDKMKRAAKKADYRVWAEGFYRDHTPHVRVAIGGIMESFVASGWALLSESPPKDQLLAAVNTEINKVAERHTAASLLTLDGVDNWMSRADVEAKAELSAVSKMILEFAGDTQ